MKMNRRRKLIILFCFLAAVFLTPGFVFMTAAAEENEESTAEPEMTFEERIAGLEEEGSIPTVSGSYLSFGDYEDTLALLGYLRKIPLAEAENFAASVRLTWDSASKTPDTETSGCGIIFNSAPGTSDYLIASVRMDGAVYVTGNRYYTKLSYGKYYYSLPVLEGSADLTVIYSDGNVDIFLNESRIGSVRDIPFIGNEIGLGILSGTYQDYGTHCKFEDIQFYTWEDPE